MIIFIRATKMGYKYGRSLLQNYLKKGKHNVVAYALSRKQEETQGSLCVIYIPQYIGWKKKG
jgi:hypothetical protein